MNYWEECISEAFDDAVIEATQEQIQAVANWVEGSHEVYGEANGHDQIGPSDIDDKREIQQLKNDLKEEQAKILCEECKGRGVIVSKFVTFESRSDCYSCKGTGRVSP